MTDRVPSNNLMLQPLLRSATGDEIASLPTPNSRPRPWWQRWVAVFSIVVVLLLWQASGTLFGVKDFVLPPPSDVAVSLYHMIGSRAFYPNLWITFVEFALAFLIGSSAGLAVGVLLTSNSVIERALMPLLVLFQAIPKVALAPLFLIWFGYGPSSKVIFAATVVFFPMLVNTVQGLKSLDPQLDEMLRSFGAKRMQIFAHGRLPSSAPYLFAGLDVCSVFAITSVVIGEFLGAREGLGYLILQANYRFDIAGTFAVIVILSVMGLLAHLLVVFAGRTVMFWHKTPDEHR